MNRDLDWYLKSGFDLKTAKYFASGRKKIKTIKPNEDYTIDVVFEGEETRILDCKDLKDKIVLEEFMNAYLEGGIVFNEKYDICPDYCYLESKIKE